jgi:hypothetical protein
MSQSSGSYSSFANGSNALKTGNGDGTSQEYDIKENSRGGRSDVYGGFNGTRLAPGSRVFNTDTDDAYGRLRADRGDLNVRNHGRNGRDDVGDFKSSAGYGSGPGARQIEGQQLLRDKF